MTVGKAGKLWLRIVCPNCGRRPPFQIYEWERIRYEEDNPNLPVSTHYCRSCRVVYVARARHYQEAYPVTEP